VGCGAWWRSYAGGGRGRYVGTEFGGPGTELDADVPKSIGLTAIGLTAIGLTASGLTAIGLTASGVGVGPG
jgi:hypothetical protein